MLASACVISTDGIVIVGSTPPIPGGGEPATLLAMITARAPAFWAFFTLTLKPHAPRSIRAILLLTAREFAAVNGSHPGPDGDVSTIGIRSPVTPAAVKGGPNCAVPTRYVPATFGGRLTTICGVPGWSTKGTSEVVIPPFHTTPRVLIADATRCALVIWS